MKALLAIGHDEESASILDLVGRLKFRDASYHLAHVIERFQSSVPTGTHLSKDLVERYLQLQEREGKERLSWAESRLKEQGIAAGGTHLLSGFTTDQLLAFSEEHKVDLIGLGSRDEAPIQKLMIGSVGRKLVTKADRSLLIARNTLSSSGPIDAVLATDHSEYAQKCVDVLLQLAPQGIRKLTILTVYPKAMVENLQAIMLNFKGPLDDWIVERLEGENQKLMQTLKPLGASLQSKVLHGDVEEAIDHTMEVSGAQLLILGAQGHGFVERLTMGSVSFQQAIAGKHSVLVLRR